MLKATLPISLPIGASDFAKIIERTKNKKCVYVDKSLFIKEILEDEETDIVLITRPRRFGKTLNLSMLHHFLASEVTGQPTQALFEGLTIARDDECMKHQGQYPVIFISLKDIKASNFEEASSKMKTLISRLYRSYNYLEHSTQLTSLEKTVYRKFSEKIDTSADLEDSLRQLSEFLFLHHGIKPWILIDEYDTPIIKSYTHQPSYYEGMIELMRGLLGAALKDNSYLERAVVTGILRIAKESLFSELNNVELYTLLDPEYSQHFGFTEEEVSELLSRAGLSDRINDVRTWYNGYQIGSAVVYNPWSIAHYFKKNGLLDVHWVGTSDNGLIRDLLIKAPLSVKEDFERLFRGERVKKEIDPAMALQFLDHQPNALWSLFLFAGYLTPRTCEKIDTRSIVTLAIPNLEIRYLYQKLTENWLSQDALLSTYQPMMQAMLTGEHLDTLQQHLTVLLHQIASVHDMAHHPEAFYHGLLLGLLSTYAQTYEVNSNQESGLGRYDIAVAKKAQTDIATIIELKSSKDRESRDLQALADDALKQIQEKDYVAKFEQRGFKKIIKIGIGFSGKELTVASCVTSRA